jgi:hypothetical protein
MLRGLIVDGVIGPARETVSQEHKYGRKGQLNGPWLLPDAPSIELKPKLSHEGIQWFTPSYMNAEKPSYKRRRVNITKLSRRSLYRRRESDEPGWVQLSHELKRLA